MLTDPSPSSSAVALDLRSDVVRAGIRLAAGRANSAAGSRSRLVSPPAPRIWMSVSVRTADAEKPI